MIQFAKISFAFLFLFLFKNNSVAQCNNFSNSITVPAQGTVNGCNDNQPTATATICADFNVTFSSGNASFFWGYSEIVNSTTTTTTNGPVNTSQSAQFPDIICVTVPCGASITFFVTAYSNPNGGGSVCNGANATISTLPFSPLPVVLSEFYAKSLNSAISLHWKTNSEINNDYFEIWKSKNGTDWFYLDRIDGQGNSSEVVLYSYIDQKEINAVNYYKLKQIDFDGRYTYSDIVLMKREEGKLFIAEVSDEQLRIVTDSPSSDIRIIDMMGRVVRSFVTYSADYTIDTGNIPSGIYILNVDDGIESRTKKVFLR